MLINNTAGLQFLFSEDIYLLRKDLDNLETPDVPGVQEPFTLVSEPKVVTEVPQITIPEPVAVKQTPVLHFDYTGGNKQRFLIICHYAASIDEKHLAALTSTLQRKELSLDDVAILNIASYTNATSGQLNEFFKPARLLILGNGLPLAGWDIFKLNQLENTNGIKVLYTYSFGEMMGDRDKTKAFWEQMKLL